RQADAVPVDGGIHLQLVDKAHTQAFPLPTTQFDTRHLAAVGPGGRLVAGDQVDIERRSYQLVIMAGCLIGAPQPVANAAGTKPGNTKACQAGKNLSAGKRHWNRSKAGKMRDFLT